MSAADWWNKSLAEAEAMGMRYDIGATCLEMGKRAGGRARLERAETIFAAICAARDLAQVREALAKTRAVGREEIDA